LSLPSPDSTGFCIDIKSAAPTMKGAKPGQQRKLGNAIKNEKFQNPGHEEATGAATRREW
jgi:hypothetical protein